MGSVASHLVKDGWCDSYNSSIISLAQRGFNLNYPDKAGRVPAQFALENDCKTMDVLDIKSAFKHGLDPLQVGPDGYSVLSVDFDQGRTPDLAECIFSRVKEALLQLEEQPRSLLIEKLLKTNRPIYESGLRSIEFDLLEKKTQKSYKQNKAARL